ncbi:hypothetical protein D3C81_1742060 [compost metagenome]
MVVDIRTLLGLASLDLQENLAAFETLQQGTATLYQSVGEQFYLRPQLLDTALKFVPFTGMSVQCHIQVMYQRCIDP